MRVAPELFLFVTVAAAAVDPWADAIAVVVDPATGKREMNSAALAATTGGGRVEMGCGILRFDYVLLGF